MPLPSRELQITYNSLVLGGSSSSYYLDAPISLSSSRDRASVEAEVVVVGSSESAFRTACNNLEVAFQTPRKKLEVKFGSAVHRTYDPTDAINTAIDTSPACIKVGNDDDTGRSRRYRISVTADLNADLYVKTSDGTSTNGRRTANVTLQTTDSGRRRLQVTGQYTASATSGSGARAQYNNNISTYITELTTAFTGTWESVFDPQVSTDDMDKVCNFSFVMEELIFQQSDGVLDDPTLRRQRMTITRMGDLSGDSIVFGIKAQKLQRVMIDYSVAVDKAQSQDLKSVYNSTIKPYLIKLAKQTASSSNGFIEAEAPTFDFVENRVSVRLTFVSQPGGSLLSARITTDESENTGLMLVPVWDADRLKKHLFVGPAIITRTVTILTTEVGLPGSSSIVGPGGVFDATGPDGQLGYNAPPGDVASGDAVGVATNKTPNAGLALAGGVAEPTQSPDGGDLKRAFLGVVHSSTPRRIGPIDGETIDVVDRMVVARYEYYVDAAGGSDYSTSGAPTPITDGFVQ